jgi:hypothetical protein
LQQLQPHLEGHERNPFVVRESGAFRLKVLSDCCVDAVKFDTHLDQGAALVVPRVEASSPHDTGNGFAFTFWDWDIV